MTRRDSASTLTAHVDDLAGALPELRAACVRINGWGARLHQRFLEGNRLLVAGNGGSAAEAQHLSAELVGRFRDDRRPFSAIALHTDTSSLTAIGNDYGYEEVFARQVRAHGRPRDVLLLLSTSGASPNLLAAADAADELGLDTWALTGPGPNPLADRCHDAVCLPGDTAVVQEGHLVAVHLLCLAVEAAMTDAAGVDSGAVPADGRAEPDGMPRPRRARPDAQITRPDGRPDGRQSRVAS